jgi:hypothetical protein
VRKHRQKRGFASTVAIIDRLKVRKHRQKQGA